MRPYWPRHLVHLDIRAARLVTGRRNFLRFIESPAVNAAP
jgi:hypothetical protein